MMSDNIHILKGKYAKRFMNKINSNHKTKLVSLSKLKLNAVRELINKPKQINE